MGTPPTVDLTTGNPADEREDLGFCCAEDELLDELDATMQVLGRLFTARHHDQHGSNCVEDLNGPRLVALLVISSQGDLRQSDLATALGVKAPAVSSLVDGLVESGYVTRGADPDDRRATRVALTELGRVTLGEIEAHRREHMRRYCSVLTQDDIRNLIRVQRKLIDSMMSGRI